jgi:hypothetical protein
VSLTGAAAAVSGSLSGVRWEEFSKKFLRNRKLQQVLKTHHLDSSHLREQLA